MATKCGAKRGTREIEPKVIMPKKKPYEDRHLTQRSAGGPYHYNRRVPKEFLAVAGKLSIKKSLKTRDLAEARQQRDILEQAEDQLWSSLMLGEGDAARERYEQTVQLARSLGFKYKNTKAILANNDLGDLLDRIDAVV